VTYWSFREQLSRQDRVRRSIYETLRDELDEYLIECGLVESYQNFVNKRLPYPFVEKRELKPRAHIPDVEYECHNQFLVIFVEDLIPSAYKKYIRFFDDNKVTKENLMGSETVRFSKKYFRNIKLFESPHFSDFLKGLSLSPMPFLFNEIPPSRPEIDTAFPTFTCELTGPLRMPPKTWPASCGISLRICMKMGRLMLKRSKRRFLTIMDCLPHPAGAAQRQWWLRNS